MPNTILSLSHINKTFKDTPRERLAAVRDVSLEIRAGEFFVFVGPSGSGKSTLLRIMSGLEHSYEGALRLTPPVSFRDMNFVFQQFALLPWLTVSENIALGLAGRDTPEKTIREGVRKELARMKLEAFAHARPHELSGGMRQRVGIARALATEPKILFLDEPFSELDSFTAEELRRELLAIWEEQHMTIVMVTHIIEEAAELADRIAVLTSRPGKLEALVENNLPRPRAKRSTLFYALEDKLHALVKP